MECPICYEAITAETGVVTTSCNHSYHFSCISGWYIKQDKGTCPCCRKEMNDKEDFPDVPEQGAESESESDSYASDQEYEVEFTRRQLQEFIASHGGHLTEQMSDAICAEIGAFTQMELNSLLVGNTGQTLTEDEWMNLLHRDIDDSDSDSDTVANSQQEEDQNSLRITISGDRRTVVNNIHETAATTIQTAWRVQKAAQALITLAKN